MEKYRSYRDAVINLGANMSEKDFFKGGAPGIDDEPRFVFPKKLKTSQGLLLYQTHRKEYVIYGFRKTPWFGETKIRLIPESERQKPMNDLLRHLGLDSSTDIPEFLFWS